MINDCKGDKIGSFKEGDPFLTFFLNNNTQIKASVVIYNQSQQIIGFMNVSQQNATLFDLNESIIAFVQKYQITGIFICVCVCVCCVCGVC